MIAALAMIGALLQAPAPAAQKPAAPPAPAPRRAAPANLTLQVRVTDRTGNPAEGVRVTAEGPVSRDGRTDGNGALQFRTVPAGTYRLRAESDKYVAFEKEITLRSGAAVPPVELALSPAPPPPEAPTPPPPAPAPAVSAPDAKPGELRVLSIVDMWEKMPTPKEAAREYPIACSGLDRAEMLVIREKFTSPADPNVDHMLYVVGGEATLTVNGRDQVVTNGWYAMIPRGMAHSWTRRGRNPVVILATSGGQPCDQSGSH